MNGDADGRDGLQGLVDQVLSLSAVQWGFVLITAMAVFLWVWVMGEPKARQPVSAGAAAVIAGVGLCLALAVFSRHAIA